MRYLVLLILLLTAWLGCFGPGPIGQEIKIGPDPGTSQKELGAKFFWHEPTISAATDFACAVDTDGDVRCWSAEGLVRINAKYSHQADSTFHSVSVSVHGQYEIVTIADDKNRLFVAGNGGAALDSKVLEPVKGFDDAGYRYAVMGYFRGYQCGIKRSDNGIKCVTTGPTRLNVDKAFKVLDFSHSFDSFCLVDQDFSIRCSGSDPIKKAFDDAIPAQEFERIAIPIDAIMTANDLAACAIRRSDHNVVCFGNPALPVVAKAPANLKAKALAVGPKGLFAVAVQEDGKLHWWGDETNVFAKRVRDDILSLGTDEMVTVVAGGWSQTAPENVGMNAFACSIKKDGTPICFGDAKLKASLAKQGAFKVKIHPPVSLGKN